MIILLFIIFDIIIIFIFNIIIVKIFIIVTAKRQEQPKQQIRDAIKKTEIGGIVPKGGRGSLPDPKFFKMFKWDIEGKEGGGSDGHVQMQHIRFCLKGD